MPRPPLPGTGSGAACHSGTPQLLIERIHMSHELGGTRVAILAADATRPAGARSGS